MRAWTSDQLETAKRLIGEGHSYRQVGEVIGKHEKTVANYLNRHGIRSKVRHRWGVPRSPLPARTGQLEDAVRVLRRDGFIPVCAEETIRRKDDPPKPYTRDTLFRVGLHRNVAADTVLKWAAGIRGSTLAA